MLTELKERQLPPRRKTPYVTAQLTVEARNALQHASLSLSAEAGQRLTMSAVLIAALQVANEHKDQFTELLAPTAEEGEQE
jgi:hypothetical protein